MEPSPVIHESRRLPFGIYAIVFFIALHVIALLLEILSVQYGTVNDLMKTAGQTILAEFGLGGVYQLLVRNESALSIVNLATIVLLCIVIAGLLAKKRWAWVTTMVLIGSSLLAGIVDYFNDTPRYLSMLVGVLVVFYLNERSVRQAYDHRERTEAHTV